MTSPVTTGRPPSPADPRRRRLAVVAAAVAAAAVVLAGTRWLLAEPEAVSRVRVVNPSPLDLEVAVRGGARDAWLPLTSVAAGSERVVEGVLDQGDVWVFRFSTGPFVATPVEVARADLARAGWTVGVPRAVVDQLDAMGATPNRPAPPQTSGQG